MKYSIVLPSKGSISGVRTLLSSLDRTVTNAGNVEVLIVCDDDDTAYADEIRQIRTSFVCKVFQRERQENFSDGYYNWLAAKTIGDAIQVFNDDAWYVTKGWDEIIREKVFGKKIWMADILDNTRFNMSGQQPCFPMVSRAAYKALGFVLHPQIKVYPADRKIFEVYQIAGKVVKCHEVQIQHDRIASEKTRLEELSRVFPAQGFVDVETDAQKLVDADVNN